MARHRQISLSFVQYGPGSSRRVHEPSHSLDLSQAPKRVLQLVRVLYCVYIVVEVTMNMAK